MKRALLAVLGVQLAACQSGAGDDYLPRPGGVGGPVSIGGPGSSTGDDGGTGDGGVPIRGRICILKDLRHLTDCDQAKDASALKVTLGSQAALAAPSKLGEFEVPAQIGTGLLWHVTGNTIITSVMPFGTDNTIPVISDVQYTELAASNQVTILAEGQGSVVVRVLNGGLPGASVTGSSTLVSDNVIPLYDADDSAVDWRVTGPTQKSGVLWFPGVGVTAAPALITLTPSLGPRVTVPASVETQAITFVTRDVQ